MEWLFRNNESGFFLIEQKELSFFSSAVEVLTLGRFTSIPGKVTKVAETMKKIRE